MGSGFVMNAYVLSAMRTLSPAEAKRALESLGTDFLIRTYGADEHEDFETPSKAGAELVKEAVRREFIQQHGAEYEFSVDVVPQASGTFKISFFK